MACPSRCDRKECWRFDVACREEFRSLQNALCTVVQADSSLLLPWRILPDMCVSDALRLCNDQK